MTSLSIAEPLLTQDMIDRLGERAGTYDRENRFFAEDFADLQASGYPMMPIAPLGHLLGAMFLSFTHLAK
jgi:hypothetical protein